jgi:hypothetical protein
LLKYRKHLLTYAEDIIVLGYVETGNTNSNQQQQLDAPEPANGTVQSLYINSKCYSISEADGSKYNVD